MGKMDTFIEMTEADLEAVAGGGIASASLDFSNAAVGLVGGSVTTAIAIKVGQTTPVAAEIALFTSQAV